MGAEGKGRKKAVVLTSRGNYGKFKRLLSLAGDFQTIVGGELILHDRVTGLFDIEPDYRVYFNVAGDNLLAMGKSAGHAVGEFCSAFDALRPELVLLVGDRFETHAAATAAHLSGVPIAHLEGGETTGALDNRLRWCISELSEVHFCCTDMAGVRLRHRGYKNVHVVGSTAIDALVNTPLKKAGDIEELQKTSGSGAILNPEEPFLLVVHHPDTSYLQRVESEARELINAIDSLRMPTFWLNANMDAGSDIIGGLLRQYRDTAKPNFIRFFKGLPIEYYGYLLSRAACMVGNSSSGVREGSFTGTPNVVVGFRQANRELGKNTEWALADKDEIREKVCRQLDHGSYPMDPIYGDGTASEKILEILRKK